MIFLGLDIGYDRCGFCIIDSSTAINDKSQKIVTAGCIFTDKALPISKRLHVLREDLLELKKKYSPDYMCIEKLFFNRKNTIFEKICMSKGIALELFSDIEVLEIEPKTVKSTIIGYGNAKKSEIRPILEKVINLELKGMYDDTIDAICLALYHIQKSKIDKRVENSSTK